MNFYKRFIGDITAKTGGLSMARMGAYDRLLDHYYSTEKPIDADEVYRICRAMSTKEKADVDAVLARFWSLGPEGFTQSKADEVIAKALPLIEAARANGKKGGRPKKPKTQTEPSGFQKQNPAETQMVKAIQSQSQISSEPIGSGGGPPSVQEQVFAVGVALLTAADVTEKNARSFLAAQVKAHTAPKVLDALRRCAKEAAIQPVPWIVATLGPGKSTSHTGFDSKNYREGVNADGSLA